MPAARAVAHTPPPSAPSPPAIPRASPSTSQTATSTPIAPTVFDSKISRFDSTGAPKNFTAGPDAGTNTLTGIFGDGGPGAAEVAVNDSNGDIYVASFFGVNVYSNDGVQVGSLDGTSNKDGYFSEPCGVAVDQSNGNVYVGDYGGRVWRYTPSGAHVVETDYSGGIATPSDTCAVAANSGAVYAADKDNGGPVRRFAASDFTNAGPLPTPAGTVVDATATALSIDPANGDLYVDEGNKVSVFDSTNSLLYSFGSSTDFGTDSAGVAVKSGGNAYVADRTANEIDVYGPLTRPYTSSFGAFATAGDPQGLTVDQSNGDIYAYSPTTVFDSKISRFDSTGAPKNFTAGPDAGTNTLTGIFGDGGPGAAEVAVNDSNGDIYVASFFGVNVYSNDGVQVGSLDGTSNKDGYFSEPCGVAVDQSNGNVYVGDYGGRVWRYTPSGAHVVETDYSGGIATPSDTCAVAANSGAVYAADKDNGGPVRRFAASDFTNAGPLPTPAGTVVDATATALSVDPANGDLYVDEGNKVSVFDSTNSLLYSFGSSTDFGTDSAGVAVKSGGNAYVADRTANEIDVYGPYTQGHPAKVTTDPATTLHHTDAVLNGHFDPKDDASITDCHFDWGTTIAYGGGTVPCDQQTPLSAPTAVTATLAGLTPGTTYHFRLHITGSSSGEVVGDDQSFTPAAFPIEHAPVAPSAPTAPPRAPTAAWWRTAALAFDQVNRRLYLLENLTNPHRLRRRRPARLPAWSNGFNPHNLPYNINNNPSIAVGSGGNVYLTAEGFNRSRGSSTASTPPAPTSAPTSRSTPAFTPAPPPAVPPTTSRGVATDSAGNIWVANTRHRVHHQVQRRRRLPELPRRLRPRRPTCDLAFDSNDNLYVGQGNRSKSGATPTPPVTRRATQIRRQGWPQASPSTPPTTTSTSLSERVE